jgi:hypothetical protein
MKLFIKTTFLTRNIMTRLHNNIIVPKIIPARLAFQKNSQLLSDIYWLGTIPSGIVCSVATSIAAIKDFNTDKRETRIMYGTVMGLIGFGGGVTLWMLWPIIVPIGAGVYGYDKLYYQGKFIK